MGHYNHNVAILQKYIWVIIAHAKYTNHILTCCLVASGMVNRVVGNLTDENMRTGALGRESLAFRLSTVTSCGY